MYMNCRSRDQHRTVSKLLLLFAMSVFCCVSQYSWNILQSWPMKFQKNHSEASHGVLKAGVRSTTVSTQLLVHVFSVLATALYGASGPRRVFVQSRVISLEYHWPRR